MWDSVFLHKLHEGSFDFWVIVGGYLIYHSILTEDIFPEELG